MGRWKNKGQGQLNGVWIPCHLPQKGMRLPHAGTPWVQTIRNNVVASHKCWALSLECKNSPFLLPPTLYQRFSLSVFLYAFQHNGHLHLNQLPLDRSQPWLRRILVWEKNHLPFFESGADGKYTWWVRTSCWQGSLGLWRDQRFLCYCTCVVQWVDLRHMPWLDDKFTSLSVSGIFLISSLWCS